MLKLYYYSHAIFAVIKIRKFINSNFITSYGIPKQTKSSNNNNVTKRSPYVCVFYCGLMAQKYQTYHILLDEQAAKAWSILCDSLLAPWPCCTFSLQRRLLCLVSSSMYSLTFLFFRLFGVPKLWAVKKRCFCCLYFVLYMYLFSHPHIGFL